MSAPGRPFARLREALGRLAEASGGVPAPFWLRDDDAAAPSAALDRLLAIAAGAGVPVALAVIPALAEPALAADLGRRPDVAVLQHGYAHRDHAPAGEKKREFGPDRPLGAVRDEIAEGWRRLQVFGGLAPIFVPPWNRIDPLVAATLGGLGFRALSAFGDRRAAEAAPGLLALNAHVDPVAWRAGRGFLGPEATIGLLVDRLDRLRDGRADRAEPTGILTHHRVHDAQTFDFLEELLQFLAMDGLSRWLSGPMLLNESALHEGTQAA